MNDGRVQALVELQDRVAEVGERARHEPQALLARTARLHAAAKRLPGNELHHHHEVAVAPVALKEARQVRQPHARTLRGKDLLVGAAQARAAADALAHEGPQLGAVLAHEEHPLRGLDAALLEGRVDPVAGVAVERGQVVGEFVVGLHAPILAERSRPPSRWSSRQSGRAPR